MEKIETVPFDARFPNQNQSRACLQNYVDYFRCIKVKGEEEDSPCKQFEKIYKALCPLGWTEGWNELRDRDLFPPLRADYPYPQIPSRDV